MNIYHKIENDFVVKSIVCESDEIKNYSGEWIKSNIKAGKGQKYNRTNNQFEWEIYPPEPQTLKRIRWNKNEKVWDILD